MTTKMMTHLFYLLLVGSVAMAGGDFPACLEFDQRQTVGRVAVDLVGRGVDERGIGRVLASSLQEAHCAVGVDREIRNGILCRPVMGRLRSRMDNDGS